MFRPLLLSILLTSGALVPNLNRVEAITLSPEQTISIQFDNGSPPIKVGEEPPEVGESFPLAPGESFFVGNGSSFFSFTDFPEAVEQVEFSLAVNPGDSFLNLALPGGFTLTTDQKETAVAQVAQGEALSIAFGFDPDPQQPVGTFFTLEEADNRTEIPEPALPLALFTVALAVLRSAAHPSSGGDESI